MDATPRLTRILQVRVTKPEAKQIQQYAKARGVTVSAFLRRLAQITLQAANT